MLSALVAIIALSLTIAMFATRERMLAWPSVIFWAIFGGYEYTLCAVTDWTDINYYLFFAGAVGMVIFCALAQFALREVDNRKTDEDEYVDEASDPDKTVYPDEEGSGQFLDETVDEDGIIKDEYIGRATMTAPSRRRQNLHRRAGDRGTKIRAG